MLYEYNHPKFISFISLNIVILTDLPNVYEFPYHLITFKIPINLNVAIKLIMMLYRNAKIKVWSIDKLKENGFKLTKERSRKYPAKTITDADYTDDIVLLSNAPDQAETLLHSLERATAGIVLYVNAHKTEYMYFNQTGDIFTLNGGSLKLVDEFTYLGHSVSSTETDINM